MLGCQLICGVKLSVYAHIGASCPIAHTVGPRDISGVCIALAYRQVVRIGASWPVLFTCLCLHTPQLVAASSFSVFAFSVFFVLTWKNIRTCGCLMAPQGGITLTTRAFRTPHHTLSNSDNVVRSPRSADIGLHTGATRCSAFKLCVLPTVYTQCQQSTGSDGPHSHRHK